MVGEDITVLRVERDEFGDPVGVPAQHTIERVVVAPRYSREESELGEKVLVGLTLYPPPGADILASDRVLVRGREYDVEGDLFDWNSLEGVAVGGEIAVKRAA